MKLGKALRLVRTMKHIKQQDLAAAAGLNVSYISSLEADQKNPTWDTMQRVCSALGVPITLVAMLSEASEPEIAPYVPLVYSAMLRKVEED